MKALFSLIVALGLGVAACGDTSSKSGSKSGSTLNNANNSNDHSVSPELANYCAMNLGSYTCGEDDSFTIALSIERDCGPIGRFEEQCNFTPDRLETCRMAIETCPQEDREDYIAERCDELYECWFRADRNNPNNSVNNIDTMNNADTPEVYTEEFQAVASILSQGCLQSECHGSFSTNNFAVSSDQFADVAEIRGALEGVQAESGNLLVAPSNPDESEIYMILIDNDEAHTLPSPQLRTLENWISNGAVYTL